MTAFGIGLGASWTWQLASVTKAPMARSGVESLSHILALGLRIRPVRRLLALKRWPRPEHLDRMNQGELHGYIRAIGIEAEVQAALAEYRGEDHYTEQADSGLPNAGGSP
jgi:hypothetical protein